MGDFTLNLITLGTMCSRRQEAVSVPPAVLVNETHLYLHRCGKDSALQGLIWFRTANDFPRTRP